MAAGQFDHPLTATVLLQLGKLEMAAGNYLGASRAFLEASYSAYNYADVDVIEEALHYGAVTHLAGGNREVYPPLAAATAWAKVNHKRSLAVSALVSTAESYATFEQTRDATVALNEAQASIGRTAVAASRLQARLNLVRGLTFFQDGKIAPGDKVVEQAIEYMRRGSFWLFQIAHADANLIASQITSRTAMELFNLLLRDPQPVDWTLDPLESLAVLMVPHTPAFEHWFLVALNRTDHDAALEISDRTRRHRYFSTLAYGGRLESLRWILEAPDAALPPNAILQRQELLAHHPRYTDLSKRAAEIRGQIAKMPLVAKDQEMAKTQSRLFADLAALCANQEVILREIAVRHEAAAMVFPPMRGIKEIQKALPKGTAMLAFFAAGGNLYAFLLNQDKYGMWTVKDTKLAAKRLQGLLREMGHWEQNHELTLNDLTNTEWKAAARQLLEDLLAGSNADFSKRFPELVIVPDGFLWYVPFETLQVNVDNRSAPLIARFRIRYAPTLSLSVPDKRGWVTEADTAVMLGRLYPRDPDAVAQSAFDDLAKVLPRCSAIGKSPPPAPSYLYRLRMGRLIVLDDIVSPDLSTVYSWAPIQFGGNRPGNTINDWLALPWGGPQTIVLPGFHTPAESSFKRSIHSPGTEIFLSVCALLSTGTRTLLISRWWTGGQSSFDLVREFAQELPRSSPSDAWQRAVLLLAESRLNTESEPRIKRLPADQEIRGNHPFFWSGYMLVDSGAAERPEGDEEPVKEEALAKPEARKGGEKADAPPGKQVPGKRGARKASARAGAKRPPQGDETPDGKAPSE